MLQNNNKTVIEMNTFDGLISRLDMAEKRITELEGVSIETSKTKKQREKKRMKKQKKISKNSGIAIERITHTYKGYQKGKKKGTEA